MDRDDMAIEIDKEIDNWFKVVLIGDSCVGKDEILHSLCHSKERPCSAYIGPSFESRTICICGKQVQLQIWNLSNQTRDFPRIEKFIKDAAGAMVVYDVTRKRTFEGIHRCLNIFESQTTVMLLGNKSDKIDREVTKDEGEKFASENGIRFIETSAKYDINVDEAFTILAVDMLVRRDLERLLKLSTLTFDQPTFDAILRFGVEQNYHIRVMLVGKEGVGKSTLLKRLLKMPVKINTYDSTNGIDVHIHSCDVDIETGTWEVNEANETGVTAIDKFWRYLGGATNTPQTNKATVGHRSFHMRVAKMLTNTQVSVPFQMANSLSKNDDVNHAKTVCTGEIGDGAPNMSNNCEESDDTTIVPLHSSIDYGDIEQIVSKTESLVALKENPKARVDFYDFAGQLVFHASHPTFLSSKAIYILTFDMSKFHSDERKQKVVGHMIDTGENTSNRDFVSDMESIVFWLNTVYMFAASQHEIYPHVILVGTHADKLPKANRDQVADACFRDIRSFLADSPLKHILSDKEFVVDNTNNVDPCFTQIHAEIFDLAKLQPFWGQQTPSRWLPLEREIQHARDSGLKVFSVEKIRDLNSKLEIQIPDEAELHAFLQFLHDTGEIIYFNETTLRNYFVLDPVFLIDALKALITADRFAIRSPKHVDKWKLFCETGIIRKSTIIDIFKENKNRELFENSQHVLRLMEKYLFIASPVDITSDNDDANLKTDDVVYIVPSMVQTPVYKTQITSPEGLTSTTVLCMVSQSNFLPSAVFHKLLAKCISKWQIVEQCGQKQIFSDVCKFNLDKQKNNKLIVVSVQHAIHAKVISYIDTAHPPPALCKRVYEFLIETLKNIFTSMGFPVEFRTCIQCPSFTVINSGGYLDTDLMVNQEVVTCDECQVSHAMLTADLINCWTDSDEETKPHMQSSVGDIETEKKEATTDMVEKSDVEQSTVGAPITQSHLNHARVCNALVTVCAEGLRDILLSQIPPGYQDFYGLLLAKGQLLAGLRNLRREQLNILFPDPIGSTGKIDQFDITLLYTLIRNISSVPAPKTGWGEAPEDEPRDTTLGAATERIRICRNNVSGHSIDGRLDDEAFDSYWKDICLIMNDIEQTLGPKGYQDELKKRKDQILSPAEARAFQADVSCAVDVVMEAMRNLQTRAKDYI